MENSSTSKTLSIEPGFAKLFFLLVVDVGVKLGPAVATDEKLCVLLENKEVEPS